MHLVKDDLIRVSDPPESGYESKNCDDGNGELVVPFLALLHRDGLVGLRLLGDGCRLVGDIGHLFRERVWVGCSRPFGILARPLAHTSGRRHGGL